MKHFFQVPDIDADFAINYAHFALLYCIHTVNTYKLGAPVTMAGYVLCVCMYVHIYTSWE